MGHPTSKKKAGLGNALMNDRLGKNGSDRRKEGITRTNHATGEKYITNEHKDASWVKMRSITEQGALDEFLATAQLAGTDFTAEKMSNVKIIHTAHKNPYMLTAAEERSTLKLHRENRDRLTVPRRPHWDETTTPQQLDQLERESFLVWRRGLAELQDNQDLLMTPFERNLEVWRQLWRVLERSDLVVQIVDARNPLLFRSADLEDYVKEVDKQKNNLLLINKADMMTYRQRRAWAKHLTEAKVAYKFFSAQLAKERNELRDLEAEEGEGDEAEQEEQEKEGAPVKEDEEMHDGEEDSDGLDTRILTVEELESLFLQHAPKSDDPNRKLQVGLVGYPNVGKSSTINALIGAKKVSVSSTPGKTKHFQTIHLSERVVLCDCPGLVFPNFATTKGDLVCNGILPIDQLREFTGPASVVASRIPKNFLEALYGITIHMLPAAEGGTGKPTAEELLTSYARARGFTKAGQGQPDESRAARYILKDYVNGKLLFVAPPPGQGLDPMEFNEELYDVHHLPEKRRQAMEAAAQADIKAALSKTADDGSENEEDDSDDVEDYEGEDIEEEEEDDDDDVSLDDDMVAGLRLGGGEGAKSRGLDQAFFMHNAGISRGQQSEAQGGASLLMQPSAKGGPAGKGHYVEKPFSHKYTQQGQAAAAARAAAGHKALTGRKARLMGALEQGLDADEARRVATSAGANKKHFKGGARGRAKKKTPANAMDEY